MIDIGEIGGDGKYSKWTEKVKQSHSHTEDDSGWLLLSVWKEKEQESQDTIEINTNTKQRNRESDHHCSPVEDHRMWRHNEKDRRKRKIETRQKNVSSFLKWENFRINHLRMKFVFNAWVNDFNRLLPVDRSRRSRDRQTQT